LIRDEARVGILTEKYPGLLAHWGDVSSPSSNREWIERTLSTFGRIDCLINNASVQGEPGRLHELAPEEIDRILHTNLRAPLHLSQLVLPEFVRQQSGVIINISGGGATQGRPRFIPYALSKCALVRLTESLALEYPELRFYAVSPGTLKTAMTKVIFEGGVERSGKAEFEGAKACLEKGGEDPARAADLILYLCHERPENVNGKLVSAIHDPYRTGPQFPQSAEWWTLRRVDNVLRLRLKELE
jgi:NAD(P)-dependent dehydrogenase (short-subunit alcohol dehydrogenase family)